MDLFITNHGSCRLQERHKLKNKREKERVAKNAWERGKLYLDRSHPSKIIKDYQDCRFIFAMRQDGTGPILITMYPFKRKHNYYKTTRYIELTHSAYAEYDEWIS